MSSNCPSDAELLLFVLAESSRADEIARHVAACASCGAIVAELRTLAGALEATTDRTAASSEACLDELALARVAEGMHDGARMAQVAHLAGCGLCRGRLASLMHLLSDPNVDAEVRRIATAPEPARASQVRRRWLVAAGAVAASAAFFLFSRSDSGELPQDHRGPTITAAAAPVPLSPVGDVAAPRTLRWNAVSGANRYRLTLFDAHGASLLDAETADTQLVFPDSVRLLPGQSYLWKVEARTGFDRWSSSELVEFRLHTDSAPGTSVHPSAHDYGSEALAISPARQIPARDSLRHLATRLSDSALEREARSRPLELREALAGTLALAVHRSGTAREEELRTARRLAAAYAGAWQDEFLVREVERFVAWNPERRAVKVWGDSVRRVGVLAFGRDGAAAAVAIWRRALPGARAIGDTAGLAATLGNIGAGLASDGRPDDAGRQLDRARALAAAVGDRRVEANALSELAGLCEARGDLAGASDRYAAAIALRERIGDTRGLASDYNNLAGLARATGDLEQAHLHLRAALAINRRDGRLEVAATNLVNLAALASLDGHFARAEVLYREALSIWRAAGRWADAADAQRGLGELELRRGDYPAARAHLRQALATYERTASLADVLAVRQALAGARAAEGDLQGALDELRVAQELADSSRAEPNLTAGLALARADVATRLNMRPQAERLYGAAQRLFRAAGDREGEAEAQQGRGALLIDQDDAKGSKALLDAALRTQLATGNTRAAALTRMLLGELSLRTGDTLSARRHLARSAAELERLGDPVALAAAIGEQAALASGALLPAAAESLYRTALASVGDRVAPEVSWRLHAGLAAALRSRGSVDGAVRELRAAVRNIERSGSSLAVPERRSAFLTDKWDVYVDLALIEAGRGRVDAAFEVSERLRATEMLGLLTLGRIPSATHNDKELVAREQDLRHHIAELTHQLERGTDVGAPMRGRDISSAEGVTREALLDGQERYAELQLELRERAPRHAALVSGATATWRDVARRLARDEAFVEYLLSDEQSLALVVTRDTVAAVALPAGRRDLARLVDFVRGTLQPRGSPRLDSLWRSPLRQLHADLIAPIERTGLLAGRKRLTVVPHAELHYLPFAALLEGDGAGRFLVERYQVTAAPSASVWLALAARPKPRHTSGTIAFAPRPDALPASAREVAAIERLGRGDARILIGPAASERAFRRDAPGRRVIHLATYGVLNKQNPLFSFVELAADGADDGRLEAHEVFGLQLAADLVVLSACQTGLASGALGDVPAGDDWIGLARAFLSAGAGRVLASLWPVEDRATAALMERFYARYTTGRDPGQALAAAQRAMLRSPATASPYYWAGFELVGGR